MTLQFEDCVDCVKVLYPQYDFLFLFDHSCRHDRQRPDGLSANRMNKKNGGNVPKMRDTTILNDDFLGPFEHDAKLRVGQTQTMVFKEGDQGPFWMDESERLALKYDQATGKMKRHEYNKGDLLKKLEESNVSPQGNTKKQLQKQCTDLGIPIHFDKEVVQEGWAGTPKGIAQVLWERGWIDPSKNIKEYTMDGRKDNFGGVITPGLKGMLEGSPDFVNEETLLQYHG